jgi:hypothetical protein
MMNTIDSMDHRYVSKILSYTPVIVMVGNNYLASGITGTINHTILNDFVCLLFWAWLLLKVFVHERSRYESIKI